MARAAFSRARVFVLVALILVILTITTVALLLAAQTHTDRIVDCIPGYHNVSGPASDCVPNAPGSGLPS